ncbi:hypothetical protein BDD43_4514 [Mucilaginibacter gracilis]|uniref:Uncharacterized protein n=1 Tax=Mucilaginibacter gracilis TaxID=423350 RepID=A0A495J6Q3_9SPHI|nr:hypothetical protein [Mucilaginibacter gracilis]RKR84282.1 hypothetical protein BDD43_4514 [Mucilaginibacter gracilis]
MHKSIDNLITAKAKCQLFSSLLRAFGTLTLLFLFCTVHVQAQSFDEWFNQKKTQIKYLTQQIAALQACRTSLEQGYAMMKSEWGAIGNFKNGEFGLHQGYYNSFSAVNPQVKGSVNVTTIQAEQQSIISQFNAIRNLNGLQANEQSYIGSVRQNIIDQCNKDLDDLQAVLSAGQLQMTDDERIKRINQITAAIKDKYVFTCSFANQVQLLSLQRNQDNEHTQTLRRYYEPN